MTDPAPDPRPVSRRFPLPALPHGAPGAPPASAGVVAGGAGGAVVRADGVFLPDRGAAATGRRPPRPTGPAPARRLAGLAGLGADRFRRAQYRRPAPVARRYALRPGGCRRWGAVGYFDAATGRPLPATTEARHAESLARWYAGHAADDARVLSVDKLGAFGGDYPYVNRVLPVWKVRLATPDDLAVYVSTADDRLVTLSNGPGRLYQAVFRAVHTGAWLPDGVRQAWLWLLLTGLLLTVRRRLLAVPAPGATALQPAAHAPLGGPGRDPGRAGLGRQWILANRLGSKAAKTPPRKPGVRRCRWRC